MGEEEGAVLKLSRANQGSALSENVVVGIRSVKKKEEQILVNVLGENTLSWESRKNPIEGPLQRLVWVNLVSQR